MLSKKIFHFTMKSIENIYNIIYMHKSKYNISDYKYIHDLNTRFRDIDAFGHVNNAVYASYIETARVELLNSWDIPRSNVGKSIIMASLKIDYYSQVQHPSLLTLGQKVVRLGKTSFDIETIIYNKKQDDIICSAKAVIVCFDFSTQTPVKLYDSIINAYEG